MISIPHDANLKPLSWTYATWKAGSPPIIRCPNNHASVMLDHVIKDNGQVIGSVLCPEPGCGFHEFVQLENWHPPALSNPEL